MAGGYRAPDGDQYDVLAASLRALGERLSELEAPTGTSLNSLVEQVQQAIANINTTVIAAIESLSYTATEIDALIASPGAIAPTTVTASGAGSFGGSLTVSGDLSTGGQFNCLDAYGFDITYTRRTAWLGNDGRLGYASSSREKKTEIRPAVLDVNAFLSLEPKWFEYKAQHEWKLIAAELPEDDPRHNPDYQIPTETGLIAEELVDAGFGEFVVYDADGKPEGIEYTMLVVPLLAVVRDLAARVAALEGAGA